MPVIPIATAAAGIYSAVKSGQAAEEQAGERRAGIESELALKEAIARPQIGYMTEVLPYMSEIMKALQPTLLGKLEAPGVPSEVEKGWWETGRRRIGEQYGDLATQVTQALLGRGRAGGIQERMMTGLQTQEAKAGEELTRQITEKQYEDLWKTIASAMQYGGMGPAQMGIPSATLPEVTAQPTDWGQIGTLLAQIFAGKKLFA